jgi:RimJ/RimL family protein N-acetyltransferase
MTLPLIETERLRLRPLAPADLEAIHGLWTDPGVRRYLWDDEVIPRARAAEVIAASEELFRQHDLGWWALRERGAGELVGFCGLRFVDETGDVEIGFGLAPSLWNRGLATEAARACLRYAFTEKNLPRVLGITDAANSASARVLEKLGMTFDRRAPHHGPDTLFYSLAREDFRPAPSPYTLTRSF